MKRSLPLILVCLLASCTSSPSDPYDGHPEVAAFVQKTGIDLASLEKILVQKKASLGLTTPNKDRGFWWIEQHAPVELLQFDTWMVYRRNGRDEWVAWSPLTKADGSRHEFSILFRQSGSQLIETGVESVEQLPVFRTADAVRVVR